MSSWRGVFLPIFLLSALHAAEGPGPATPTLRQLSQKAGYIFSGTVLEIRRVEPVGAYGVASMQISFQVDRAIRGVNPKQVIRIREWIGLWNDGDRYREGERLLLFLYPRSKLGLTSPVAGNFGRFNIDEEGGVVLEAARVSTLSSDPILKPPLRAFPPKSSATVRGQDFRRAILRAMEEDNR